MRQKCSKLIYLPDPQIYPGPDGNEVKKGEFYEQWSVNDHCHICAEDGKWHMFGIAHPLTSAQEPHDGEYQLFHAVSDSPLEKYRCCGMILPPSERPGERPEFHSPTVIHKDGFYYMICGPEDIRMYRSKDLYQWEKVGTIFSEPDLSGARDPQIQMVNGRYLLTYCIYKQVCYRWSDDLFNWSERQLLMQMPENLHPESPFVYFYNGKVYLFLCLWDGENDHVHFEDSYQSITHVYRADELREMSRKDFYCTLRAHAPEILNWNGKIFMTSAFYPENGINIMELIPWND